MSAQTTHVHRLMTGMMSAKKEKVMGSSRMMLLTRGALWGAVTRGAQRVQTLPQG